MALLTFSTAKKHLRITTTDQDGDLLLKLTQAEAIVLDYLNSSTWWQAVTVTWTAATVPGQVQAAILLVLTHLVEHRGEDAPTEAALSVNVQSLLMRSRDPALA
jgi:hypothetical protein